MKQKLKKDILEMSFFSCATRSARRILRAAPHDECGEFYVDGPVGFEPTYTLPNVERAD